MVRSDDAPAAAGDVIVGWLTVRLRIAVVRGKRAVAQLFQLGPQFVPGHAGLAGEDADLRAGAPASAEGVQIDTGRLANFRSDGLRLEFQSCSHVSFFSRASVGCHGRREKHHPCHRILKRYF